MSSGFTTEKLIQTINIMAAKMVKSSEELNQLDNLIGDGDIGITMKNGFRAMQEKTAQFPEDVGSAFMMCAQAFTSSRASSFATLFATGLMAAAKETKGMTEVPYNQIPKLLDAAIEKMALRGKSNLGDKTVLDEMAAIRGAIREAESDQSLIETVDNAAEKALHDFKNRPCRQGRARIFGDRTIGIDDPGMVVIRLLVQSLRDAEK
ncbi:MAG TPA: DAK2 domain-containing protein [Candidatus Cloacimonetes bacterium]|nr:DAK2 domain-containing protein [Candidatus Cloacimonadota bacterium]HEX37450.1 DAK2 domain-containing protein [Candidatus Cloacimonadota bacterium]